VIVPEYVPGDWHAVVAGGVVALLDPSTPAEVVRAVWEAVPAHGGLADQLEVLLQGGIAGLRPFALVDLTGGRVHAALRGEVEVEVVGAGGVRVLGADEVTTWCERTADDADEVTVRVVGRTRPGDATLPVVSGVVRVGAVHVHLGAGRHSRPVAPPATAEAPLVTRAVAIPLPDLADDRLFAEVVDPVPASGVVAEAEAVLAADARGHEGPAPELQVIDHGVIDHGVTAHDVTAHDVTDHDVTDHDVTDHDVTDHDDHDGLTILSSDLQSIRDQLPSWAGDAVPGPFRVAARTVAPPAKLVLSTGQVVVLDHPVLLGRAPQVSRVTCPVS